MRPPPADPAQPPPRRRRAVRTALIATAGLLASGCLFLAALLAVAAHVVYVDRTNLPDLDAFLRFDCPAVGRVYDEQGVALADLSREHRRLIAYDQIPKVVRDAILAAEDQHFFSHGGVDFTRLLRVIQTARLGAVLTRLTRVGREDKAGSLVMMRQGGSTITQQLVRAYYLRALTDEENGNEHRAGALSFVIGARSAKKLARKLEEIRLSIWLEEALTNRLGSRQLAKEAILARYASYLYLGNGQYGFASAANYYFGRQLSSFTSADVGPAALLAGIAKSPRSYAPDASDPKRVLHRRNQILRLMRAHGSLPADAARFEVKQPLLLADPPGMADPGPPGIAQAVVGAAIEELRVRYSGLELEQLMAGTFQIQTTADARVQAIANEALEHGLAAYEARHPDAAGVVQGAVVVLRNRDASILAEVGGRRLFEHRVNLSSDFNRATQSARQPGSAMKPVVYLAALQKGRFNLESLLLDAPISVPDGLKRKAISNYDGRFKGWIPLRQALAESRNAAAIWLTRKVGVGAILDTARALGIESRLQPFPTTALGASEVTLLELANAYRSIAAGVHARPHLIRELSRDGAVIAPGPEELLSQPALDAGALELLREGLRGVVRLPSGTAHALDAPEGFPVPVMAKTGTTSQFKDALFVGSTYGAEGITVAVRVGFDDDHGLGPGETGGRVALPVFREIMLRIHLEKLASTTPAFPEAMEASIANFLRLAALPPAPRPAPVIDPTVPEDPGTPADAAFDD